MWIFPSDQGHNRLISRILERVYPSRKPVLALRHRTILDRLGPMSNLNFECRLKFISWYLTWGGNDFYE